LKETLKQENEYVEYSRNLKKLISENPNAQIMIVGIDKNEDKYVFQKGEFEMEEITFLSGNTYTSKFDMEEDIYCEMFEKYPSLNKWLLEKLIERKINKFHWQKVILISI